MFSRRTLLSQAVAGGALLGLAACSSSTTASSAASSAASRGGPGGGGQASPAATSDADKAIIATFEQKSFSDSSTGDTLAYNLFTPAGYDGSKCYPLVLFMEDSSVVGTDTTAALTQGYGALCWASDADQQKRPCFVLAPQYASTTVNDNSEATSLLDTTVNLVNELTRTLKI